MSIISSIITWASPRYVQELATILGPQNRTQGRCDSRPALRLDSATRAAPTRILIIQTKFGL